MRSAWRFPPEDWTEAHNGDIAIRRALPHFTMEELFQGKSAAKWRAAYSGAFDCSPEVGREVVEE